MPRRVTSVIVPTAHLVGPGKLKVINEKLAYAQHGQPPLRLDPTQLKNLICYGDVSISGSAMELLFAHGVQTSWMSPAGNRCRGRLMRSDVSSTATRLRQHQAFAQPEAKLAWARLVVVGKIAAMSDAARHYQRHGRNVGSVLQQLETARLRAADVPSLESLRGIEGAASHAWFDIFGGLLQPPWTFARRVRRPPTDPVNALLSLGYTWLANRAGARLEAAGCELYLGGLHEYRAGRPALACDLMEPLRVTAVDRWVVSQFNGSVYRPENFISDNRGGICLQSGIFGGTLQSWETHWSQRCQDDVLQHWLDQFFSLLNLWTPVHDQEGMTNQDGTDL